MLVLWGTMWAGTMIYTSGAGEEGSVVFLTVMVAAANVCMTGWLVVRLVREYTFEKRDTLASLGQRGRSLVSSARLSKLRMSQRLHGEASHDPPSSESERTPVREEEVMKARRQP